MITLPSARPNAGRLAAWLAALALLPVGLAAAPVTVDASGVAFADVESGVVATAGIELAHDGGWVVAFGAAGEGALGDAIVTGTLGTLPTDALGSILLDEALARVSLVEHVGDGVTFVVDGTSVSAVADAFAAAFQALGGEVRADLAAHVLTVSTSDGTLRAVFGSAPGGVRVYLGS